MLLVRNHYTVLGLPRSERTHGIRAWVHDLAERLHPAHAGPGGMVVFQEIQEAYEVLGDPPRRRAYDDDLVRVVDHPASPEVEARAPSSASLRAADVHPSMEALVVRILRNFRGRDVPKAEGLERLAIDLVLTPAQASRGGLFTIGVPVFERCPDCRGMGTSLLLRCAACHGEGLVETERPVEMRIPRQVPDEARFAVPLTGLGIHNFYLSVRVRIDHRDQPRSIDLASSQ